MKDFVLYKQALALKELGFDEPCLGLFREDSSFLYADVFSYREPYSPSEFKEGFDENVFYINSQILEELVTAPTYSQAFRWLLKNYNLYGIIIPTITMNWTFKTMTVVEDIIEVPPYKHVDANDYKTYEEAEFVCLIKLIEIVKTKSILLTNELKN